MAPRRDGTVPFRQRATPPLAADKLAVTAAAVPSEPAFVAAKELMPDASTIRALASPTPDARERAAMELFAEARALCAPIITAWLNDAALFDLFRLNDRDQPRMTAGIAVQPPEFEQIRAANGNPRLADVPPDQDAAEFELHFGGDTRLDVLTTRAPGGAGAIARFLEKFGEGIQQAEFEVTSVDAATDILRERFKLAPLYPATRPGANGTRVNFFLAARPDGRKVLVELVESA